MFRGLGNTKAFVSVGIISAFFIGLLSLVFVVWMGMGIKGVFVAEKKWPAECEKARKDSMMQILAFLQDW